MGLRTGVTELRVVEVNPSGLVGCGGECNVEGCVGGVVEEGEERSE